MAAMRLYVFLLLISSISAKSHSNATDADVGGLCGGAGNKDSQCVLVGNADFLGLGVRMGVRIHFQYGIS